MDARRPSRRATVEPPDRARPAAPGGVLFLGTQTSVANAVSAMVGAHGGRVRVARVPSVPRPRRSPRASRTSVPFELADPTTWKPVLDEVDRIFVTWPLIRHDQARQLLHFLSLAGERGVRRIVGCSIAGAAPGVPHHRLERTVEASGVPFVLLRPTPTFQLLLHEYAADIVVRDLLRMPFGHEGVAMVDARDVATVANAYLGGDPTTTQGNLTVTLTGQRAVSGEQIAACLSDRLGRRIVFRPVPFHHYRRELVASGKPLAKVYAELLETASLRLATAGRVDPSLARLLGRSPVSLEEFVSTHRAAWESACPR